jgi:hypothetical protein
MGPLVLLLWIALTGIVKTPAGSPVPNATVSIRNVATGATTQVTTDAAGRYTAPDLPPGNYEVTAAAQAFGPTTAKIAVATAAQTLDLTLKSSDLSLGDLGFTPDQTKGSAADQARLDRRTHMLKTHQRLGLITIAPLVGTLIAANGAKDKHNDGSTSSSGRQLHAALGGITAGMYITTASFAIFAPKAPAGTTVRGPIRVHRMLAWVHGSGMILTPILGAIAYQQRERGEKVHGIAQAHAPAALVTSIAYGLAIASVSIKF